MLYKNPTLQNKAGAYELEMEKIQDTQKVRQIILFHFLVENNSEKLRNVMKFQLSTRLFYFNSPFWYMAGIISDIPGIVETMNNVMNAAPLFQPSSCNTCLLFLMTA